MAFTCIQFVFTYICLPCRFKFYFIDLLLKFLKISITVTAVKIHFFQTFLFGNFKKFPGYPVQVFFGCFYFSFNFFRKPGKILLAFPFEGSYIFLMTLI